MMASGEKHERINLTALAVMGGAWVAAEVSGVNVPTTPALSFAATYLVGTLYVTPDMDLAEQARTVRPKRRWGRFGALWVPYGLYFRHRGISHSYLVGPMTRIVYLGVILALPLGVAFGIGLIPVAVVMNTPAMLGGLAGFYVSQWMHLWADGIR